MKMKTSLIAALSFVLAVSSLSQAHDKKKRSQRGMLESMQSVPCGAKERGLTGLGGMMASVGVTHVNSQEQLCSQYLLRTDDMDYHIRPLEKKHATVLPVGREAEFIIKKDRMFLKVVDEKKKATAYQVVAMQPTNAEGKAESTAYHAPSNPVDDRPMESRPQANSRTSPPPTPSIPPSEANKLSEQSEHPPQL